MALRVLQVGPLPPPVGGMATVVSNLAEGLAPHVEVRILNNVKTTAADRPVWAGVVAQVRLLGRLAQLCLGWRPAVVHIHTCSWFTFWRNAIDVALARLLRRKVVLHVHGGEFQKFLESMNWLQTLAAKRVLGLANRVVVLGDGWKQLIDRWTDPVRVVVIPNGVPVGAAAQPGLGSEFVIVCLASYEPRKGQADLLQAVAELRSNRLVRVALLGVESTSGQRAALQQLADELGLGQRTAITGPVVGPAKDAWLRQADCFCLPSYVEGLPMSMLEAMAIGLPVVVTRVGAIPEAVVDGEEGLLYSPGDVPALTAHLQRLLDDPAYAQAIGRRGRERLIKDFSLESSVQRLTTLYDELTSPLPGSAGS